MHVVFLDDGLMYRAIGMGLCQKMDSSPVLNDVYQSARLKGDMAVGVNMGMTGLAYNKAMFDEKGWPPPTSWMDWPIPSTRARSSSSRPPAAPSACTPS